jgi:hypothetical protein
MVKIKRIAMAFVFLLSQVSLAKTSAATGSGEVFDSLPLSAMILTETEINNLKNEDKIIYLKALMYLGQVIEISQSNNFEYEVPAKYEGKKTGSIESSSASNSLYSIYWNLLVSESQAILAGIVKGAEWVTARLGAKAASTALRTAEAAKNISGGLNGVVMRDYAARIASAEKLKDVAKVAKLEKEVTARGLDLKSVRALSKLPDGKVLKASIETQLKEVRVLERQLEQARAAGHAAEIKKLDLQVVKARSEIAKTQKSFYAQGGKRSELDSIYRSSNTSTARWLANNAAEAVLLVGAGYYGGKEVGIWGDARVKLEGDGKGSRRVRDTMSSPDANKDPGQILREEGYSCIYGGRPSTFVKGEKGILCKMPEEGQSKTCNVNNGKYLCPTYGFRKNCVLILNQDVN